jgi:hypothetical protein
MSVNWKKIISECLDGIREKTPEHRHINEIYEDACYIRNILETAYDEKDLLEAAELARLLHKKASVVQWTHSDTILFLEQTAVRAEEEAEERGEGDEEEEEEDSSLRSAEEYKRSALANIGCFLEVMFN